MRCAVPPYGGNDPYIYFSFCKEDEAVAGPIIESMAKSGYRVWYDGGSIPDDVWAEKVMERLSNSRVCIALLSEASVNVHACRNDINMALELGVLVVPVLMEEFSMTLAMRLLAEKTPGVKAYTFSLTDASGMEKLLKATLKPTECGLCRQAAFRDKPWTVTCVDPNAQKKPDRPKRIPGYNPRLLNCTIHMEEPKEVPKAECSPEALDAELPNAIGKSKQEEDTKKAVSSVPAESEHFGSEQENLRSEQGKSERILQDKEEYEVTIRIGRQDDTPPTRIIGPKEPRALIDLSTGVVFHLREGVIRLGRSKSNDLCFDDKSISAKHAQFFVTENGKAMVRDIGSTNGTYLNGVEIKSEEPSEVGNFSIITLSHIRHLLYLTGKSVFDMLQHGYSAYLVCEENGEVMGLHPGFILGRENPWPSGAFGENSISREHGVFLAEKGGYRFLASRSTNGTTFNGTEIHEGQKTDLLKTNDEIGVAGMYWVKYHVVKLREE